MSDERYQPQGPYTVRITDSSGHECLNVELDGYHELTPQENILWMLSSTMTEALRFVPDKKRWEIENASIKKMAELAEEESA